MNPLTQPFRQQLLPGNAATWQEPPVRPLEVQTGPEHPPRPAPLLTILFGPGEDLLAPDTVSSPGKGQHLDAVVRVFLQPIQLEGGLRGGDVFNLAQLWRTRKHEHVTMAVSKFLLRPSAGPPSVTP